MVSMSDCDSGGMGSSPNLTPKLFRLRPGKPRPGGSKAANGATDGSTRQADVSCSNLNQFSDGACMTEQNAINNPENKEPWVEPKMPHEPIGQCAKCKMDLYRIMGFYCHESNCPAGLGGFR